MESRVRRRASWSVAAVCCSALLGACSGEEAKTELSPPRDSSASAGAAPANASTGERLGVATTPPPAANSGAATAGGAGALTWQLPSGWSELPLRPMRLANFRVTGNEQSECYLTQLAGDGGGLAPNVNRWRSQMGQSALSEAELAALTKKPMLGGEAVFVDINGSFAGMGGERVEKARLLGLLLFRPDGAWFLKLTGPSDVVAGQVDNFLALAASLRG